jgi:hypothetical protein
VQHAQVITEGPVNPLIFFYTPEEYLRDYLGTSELSELTAADWLSFSEHRLLALSKAEFYRDDLHFAEMLKPLKAYPDDVWLYLAASNWSLLAEEQAFVKRCADVGDELGSVLACSRIAERLMRLCFLCCREYAPYSKWFGTAFNHLPISAELRSAITGALTARDITERENNLVLAQKLTADLHDSLRITEPANAVIQSCFGRNIKVIFADTIAGLLEEKLIGTALEGLPLIGSMSEVANFTAFFDDLTHRECVKTLYR